MPKKKEPVDSTVADDLFYKAKTIKGGGLIQLLQKSDYEGCPVYIFMIDGKIFLYLVLYKNEPYIGYNLITPEKGKKKLTKDQIAQCGALIFTGAITTIDTLLEKKDILAKDDSVIVS